MTPPVAVVIRPNDCPCPGTPHTEETVWLAGEAELPLCIFAYKVLGSTEGDWLAKEAALITAYIPRGITAWTFTGQPDANGIADMLPITQENAEALIPWDKGGHEVVQKANDLYSARVLEPFLREIRAKSPPISRELQTGQKDESISATPPSGSPLPARSRRSSPTSSAGK